MLSTLAFLSLSALLSCVAGDFTTTCTGTLKQPPPPEKYCGSRGTIKSPSVSATYTGYTYPQCRDACLTAAATSCASFTFTNVKGRCILYNKTLQNMDYNQAQTKRGLVNYNRNCFTRTCTTTCSLDVNQAPNNNPDNLISYPDGSFEGANGQGNWIGVPHQFVSECDEDGFPYDALHFARISYGDVISYDFDLPNGTDTVQISSAARISSIVSGDSLSLYFENNNGGFTSVPLGSSVMDSYGTYTTTLQFPSSGSQRLNVFGNTNQGDTIDADDIVVTPAS